MPAQKSPPAIRLVDTALRCDRRDGMGCDYMETDVIKFDVMNRVSGAVQFTAEIEASEEELCGVKLGLAVIWAVKNGADLSRTNLYGANLSGADLSGADLSGANLSRANLYHADLYGANGVNDYLKCIQIDQYPITYTSDALQIGCERHAISDWADFDDHRIAEMDGKDALKFWRKYKDWIFQTIELCPAKPTGYVKQEAET